MGANSATLKPAILAEIKEQLKQLVNNDNFKKDVESLRDYVEAYSIKEFTKEQTRKLGGKEKNPFSIDSYIYYKLKAQETKEDLYKIYDKSNEIIENYIRKSDKLDYAIYYQGKDGEIYRMKVNSIENLVTRSSTDDSKLSLSLAEVRKAVQEELEKKDKKLKNLLNVTDHYSNMVLVLNNCYRGTPNLPNKKINQGHLTETFERHLQRRHPTTSSFEDDFKEEESAGWELNELWLLVRQSLGNDPWYSGGDVNSTQVKFFTEGEHGGNVRVSSTSSFITVVNILINTLTLDIQNDSSLQKAAELYYNKFWQDSKDVFIEDLDEKAKQDLKEEIQKLGFKVE